MGEAPPCWRSFSSTTNLPTLCNTCISLTHFSPPPYQTLLLAAALPFSSQSSPPIPPHLRRRWHISSLYAWSESYSFVRSSPPFSFLRSPTSSPQSDITLSSLSNGLHPSPLSTQGILKIRHRILLHHLSHFLIWLLGFQLFAATFFPPPSNSPLL